jgi:cation diffusion facilitator CzcD-associated flavoprotein CzcO
MGQRALSTQEQDAYKSIYKSIFKIARQTATGLGYDTMEGKLSDTTEAEREKVFEELWARGAFNFNVANYRDYLVDPKSNRIMYDFWAKKVRQRLIDPEKRDFLAPLEPPYAIGTKRSSLEQDYYECLDQDNVEVVSVKKTPIKQFTETGITTEDGKERQFDIIVLATGYDSMTGSLTGMGLKGKDGVDMKQRWKNGVWTHLGMLVSGCPNMFMVYGPQGEIVPFPCVVDTNLTSTDGIHQRSRLP